MSIEKRFSTTKKAIQGRAEKKSEEGYLFKPQQRHYDESFDFYKKMKIKRPERMEELIKMYSGRKDLKDQMGNELFTLLNRKWQDLTREFDIEMVKETADFFEKYFQKNQYLPRKEFEEKMEELSKNLLGVKAETLKRDPDIASSFTGKEDILNQALDFIISSTIFEMRNSYYFS